MKDNQRYDLTRFIWVSLLLTALGMTIFGDLGGVIVPVLLFVLGAGVVVTGFIWNWGDGSLNKQSSVSVSEDMFGKRKRDEWDDVLRNLSDEELIRLRRRLSDGTLTEEMLYEELLGDDGEFRDRR
jgi:hypothetical protein